MSLPRSATPWCFVALLRVLLLLFTALSLFPAARAAGVLTVDSVSGSVQVDHLGETRTLEVGEELRERDVVRLANDARLSLRFAHDGALELGQGAALAIERLPASGELADLRSIFNLSKGYLHIVWKRPPPPAVWPLYVYFGGQRSSLVEGEYFFGPGGDHTRTCVAAGRLTVTAIAGNGRDTLRPSACYAMKVGNAPRIEPRTPDSWLAVRQQFTLDPDPTVAALAAPAKEAEQELPASTPGAATAPSVAAAHAPTAVVVEAPTASALPAPDVHDAIATTAEAGWTVIVGSFADAQNAAQVQQKLIAAGYTPFLRVKILDGKTWNSVQLRGYTTREAAQARLIDVQTKLGFSNLRVVQLQ